MPKPLTAKSFVSLPDGTARPFSDLSQNERSDLVLKIHHKLSAELSLYYSRRPNEYINLCECSINW